MDINLFLFGYRLYLEEIGVLFCRNNDFLCFVVVKIICLNVVKIKIIFVNWEINFCRSRVWFLKFR